MDSNNNSYNFSQIFIDENKEILGTDIKSYLNDKTSKLMMIINRGFCKFSKSKRGRDRIYKNIFTIIIIIEKMMSSPISSKNEAQ